MGEGGQNPDNIVCDSPFLVKSAKSQINSSVAFFYGGHIFKNWAYSEFWQNSCSINVFQISDSVFLYSTLKCSFGLIITCIMRKWIFFLKPFSYLVWFEWYVWLIFFVLCLLVTVIKSSWSFLIISRGHGGFYFLTSVKAWKKSITLIRGTLLTSLAYVAKVTFCHNALKMRWLNLGINGKLYKHDVCRLKPKNGIYDLFLWKFVLSCISWCNKTIFSMISLKAENHTKSRKVVG